MTNKDDEKAKAKAEADAQAKAKAEADAQAKLDEEAKLAAAYPKRVKFQFANIHNGNGGVFARGMVIELGQADYELFKPLTKVVQTSDGADLEIPCFNDVNEKITITHKLEVNGKIVEV